MSGLIDYPTQIWVAVVPVDMRRGWTAYRPSFSRVWGMPRVPGRRLSFVIELATGYGCCCGMAMAFGCVSAVCIKGLLSGPRSAMRCLS